MHLHHQASAQRLGARNAPLVAEGSVSFGRLSVARERNNIYAIAADAVDLALDTAGTIGSMMGGFMGMMPTKSDQEERREADDASHRIASSLRQEAQAAEPQTNHGSRSRSRTHKSRSSSTRHA